MRSRLFVVAALFCASFFHAFAKEWKGKGSLSSPYLIQDVDDILRLSQSVNEGEDYQGAYFRLEANLDLGTVCGDSLGNWIPIGSIDHYFEGSFDGGGHSITRLYMGTQHRASYKGLFGYVGPHGSITDLTVEGDIEGVWWMGLLAGANGGRIDRCAVKGGSVGSWQYAGGVVGGNFGIVTNCVNYASVASALATGGIAGYNYGKIYGCQNYGEIHGEVGAGGIVGYNGGYSSFSNCYNVPMGIVQDSHNDAFVLGVRKVGGVLGRNDGLMANVYNLGEVTAGDEVGGLVGYNGGFDGVDGFVYNSYNQGDVNSSGSYAGGIAGVNNSVGDVLNVYHSGAVKSVGLSAALLASNEGNLNHGYAVGDTCDLVGEENGFSSENRIFAAGDMYALADLLNQWVDEDGEGKFSRWKTLSESQLPEFSNTMGLFHNVLVQSFHGVVLEDFLVFAEGSEVVLTLLPDSGYSVVSVEAFFGSERLPVSCEENQVRFEMPGGDVSLYFMMGTGNDDVRADDHTFVAMGGWSELIVRSKKQEKVRVHTADGKFVGRFDISAGEQRRIGIEPGMYIVNGIEVVVR